MSRLPRAEDNTRAKTPWQIFVEGGFERLTYALIKGDPIEDVESMVGLARRFAAFDSALKKRLDAESMNDVLEDRE